MPVRRGNGLITCLISAVLASPNLIAWLVQFMYQHQIFAQPNGWWWKTEGELVILVWIFGLVIPVVLVVPAVVSTVRKNIAWYLRIFPWLMCVLSAYGYFYVKHAYKWTDL